MRELPLIVRVNSFGTKIAIHTETETCSYKQLLDYSQRIAVELLGNEQDLREKSVSLLAPPDAAYVASQWAIWRAGGVCVPLSLSATESEWEYALTDSESEIVLTTEDLANRVQLLCQRLGIRVVITDLTSPQDCLVTNTLPEVDPSRNGMILYTSGTTSKPKGVVTTHANIEAQITSLIDAWEWSSDDRIPLFLPLHHIHGIINVVSCALWSGATLEPFPRFDANAIMDRVQSKAYTLFMAVPTIYVKLIEWLEKADEQTRTSCIAGFQSMRLMVSGSAALPSTIFEHWYQLTGQRLLERYGMTEIGMALSNPYRGDRRAGTVGIPLPGVEIRLKSESGYIQGIENEPGEIQVRGKNVFREYWKKPQATHESFDDGWFQTGDMAVIETGYFRILGRLSVDIIKSGGYKLSALEIEAILLEHPSIRECAVVGLPDDVWGEAVVAVVVLMDKEMPLDTPSLRSWCKDRMSSYKIPQHLLVVEELPRNAMGKVTKPAVQSLASALLKE